MTAKFAAIKPPGVKRTSFYSATRLTVDTQQTFLQVSSSNGITFIDKYDLILFNFARRHVRETNHNITKSVPFLYICLVDKTCIFTNKCLKNSVKGVQSHFNFMKN